MFAVRKMPFESARGSVYPTWFERSRPRLRNPRRMATSEAPGMASRNAATPRTKSSDP
ncbi:Uncharacterised protein [Mycobacteroides abscessus]|nr:Uncharacterised protein [Mycobacteroides abscessus]